MDILVRKETRNVGGLGRITAYKLYRIATLEDAGYLITGHQNRNASPRALHPLRELPLGMGIRPIHFI
jgi:hypothetical protein